MSEQGGTHPCMQHGCNYCTDRDGGVQKDRRTISEQDGTHPVYYLLFIRLYVAWLQLLHRQSYVHTIKDARTHAARYLLLQVQR